MVQNLGKLAALFLAASTSIALAEAKPGIPPSSEAKQGNWSSGGGEILEHAQNPWFLDGHGRPRPIRYCVMSGTDFPIPLPDLENLVTRTFRWWNDQFSNAYYPENKFSVGDQTVNFQVSVNTSRYIKEECNKDTDLSFQFGTLTTEQQNEFQRLQVDLTRYVALTIRTDYSDDLRGKGFIYISPDRGPNAFKGQNIRPEAWTAVDQYGGDPPVNEYGSRLQSVLTHELGHVFGLAHADSNDSIMGARHAELIVSKPSAENIASRVALKSAVFFPKAREFPDTCGNFEKTKDFRTFFEIPSEMDCFSIHLSLNSLIVEMSENSDSPKIRVGTAEFADGGQRRHKQLVTLWLPQTQKAFPNLPNYVSSLLGPAGSEVQHSAVFKMEGSSKEKAIFVQASPRYVQIGGASETGIIPDLLPESAHGLVLSGWNSK